MNAPTRHEEARATAEEARATAVEARPTAVEARPTAVEARPTAGAATGQRLTTALFALAFVALANVFISVARLVSSSQRDGLSLRLLIEAAIGAALLAWALARGRACRALAPAQAAKPARLFGTDHHVEADGIEQRSWSGGGRPEGRYEWLRRARRVLVPIVIVLAAASVLSQWGTLEAALRQLTHLHWKWVRLSIYAEALSIVAFAWLGVILLRAGRRRLNLGSMIGLTLASNALSTSIPGGPAWAATFWFDQLRRREVSRRLAACALIFMLLISAAALVALLLVGIDLAGDSGPAAQLHPLVSALLVGFALMALGLLAVLRLRPARAPLSRALQSVRGRRLGRLSALMRKGSEQLGVMDWTPRVLLASVGAALCNWITDCACLIGSIAAVSGHVPWRGVLVAYALAQVVESLPITPGGIGVVEGSLSLLLIAYGMPSATAVASVLLYRIISFWILVPLGWATAGAMLFLQRHGRPRPMRIPLGAQSARSQLTTS